jgi:hypothetical protein
VVSFTPLLLYYGEASHYSHWIGGWVGPRAGLNSMETLTEMSTRSRKIMFLGV